MYTLKKNALLLLLLLLCLTACQGKEAPPAPDRTGTADPAPSLEPDRPADTPPAGIGTEPASSQEKAPAPQEEDAPVSGGDAVVQAEEEPEAPASPETGPEPVTKPEPPSDPEPDPNYTLHILMYHSVVPEGTPCNTWMVTDTRLREDLQWLDSHGYDTLLPSELASGGPLPEKAVLLTFDDGYDNNYTLAYPLFREFQAKAVISLVTGFQEDQTPGYLDWEMCEEMAESGLVELGSHTHRCHEESPRGIQRAKDESQEDYQARVFTDLQTSIDLIETNTGVAPRFFAYPFGQTEKWAKEFLKEQFDVTVTTRHGSADVSNGLYAMNRYTVSMDTPLGGILPE